MVLFSLVLFLVSLFLFLVLRTYLGVFLALVSTQIMRACGILHAASWLQQVAWVRSFGGGGGGERVGFGDIMIVITYAGMAEAEERGTIAGSTDSLGSCSKYIKNISLERNIP